MCPLGPSASSSSRFARPPQTLRVVSCDSNSCHSFDPVSGRNLRLRCIFHVPNIVSQSCCPSRCSCSAEGCGPACAKASGAACHATIITAKQTSLACIHPPHTPVCSGAWYRKITSFYAIPDTTFQRWGTAFPPALRRTAQSHPRRGSFQGTETALNSCPRRTTGRLTDRGVDGLRATPGGRIRGGTCRVWNLCFQSCGTTPPDYSSRFSKGSSFAFRSCRFSRRKRNSCAVPGASPPSL